MISINGVEHLKAICEMQVDVISGGIMYLINDITSYTWKKASADFPMNIFNGFNKFDTESVSSRAMKENKKLEEKIPRSVYGTRVRVLAEPIVNDEGQAVGAFSIVIPMEHSIIKAFDDFAPFLCEMFSDGAVIFVTDMNKYISFQNSKNFQLPVNVGDSFDEDAIAARTIKAKKAISEELVNSTGTHVLEVCNPIIDEETGLLIGTFGIIIPKVEAAMVREVSKNLEDGLGEIAATIEELAASASSIHVNEQDLNKSIGEITNLSQEIYEVSSFIKEIADETKMLGLNAAIEAARVGEAGRGFGVVAEEIRKLSEQSKSTVPKIQKLTNEIIAKVNESSVKSQNSLTSSEEQAAATEEISASVEEITSMSEELNKIALRI